MAKKGFIFYPSFRAAFDALNAEQTRQLLYGLMDFAFQGEEPHFDDILCKSFFEAAMRPTIEANQKLFENSKKGGAPKANKNAAKSNTEVLQTEEKQQAKTTKGCTENNQRSKKKQPLPSMINETNTNVLGNIYDDIDDDDDATRVYVREETPTMPREIELSVFNNQAWVESVAMKHGLRIENIPKLRDEFFLDCDVRGHTHPVPKRVKEHFDSWLSAREYYTNRNNQNRQSNGTNQISSFGNDLSTPEGRRQDLIDFHNAKYGTSFTG